MEFLISFPGPLRAGSWEVWGSFQAAVPRRPPQRIWSRRPWSASIWSYRWRRFAHCLAWWRFSGQVPRLETWELRQVMIIMKLLCLEYSKYVWNISPRKRKYPDMRPQAVLRRTYTDKSFSPGPHSRIVGPCSSVADLARSFLHFFTRTSWEHPTRAFYTSTSDTGHLETEHSFEKNNMLNSYS